MAIRKTTNVSTKLNSSLMISDNGKNTTGTFSALMIPAELIILPIDWLVTLEKKNQKISPEVAYSTKFWMLDA
jgi:hypothetical protein